MEQQNQTNTTAAINPAPYEEFEWIDKVSSLLDNKFRLPFTQIRFGVDFLIGLIPSVGDWLSFGISSILVFAMMRRGIGVVMLFKMLGNIILDALVGSIPILGDLFDLHYKANRRNVAMLRQYYVENPNPPAAKRSFFIIFLLFFSVLIGLLILVFKLMAWFWGLLAAYF
ncbi:MAG: DUF4112 domain-containing protein [Saprospiraceae bacterium]|nr:DUF4112 domain-containing protein [Saprospiraceae bacterium]